MKRDINKLIRQKALQGDTDFFKSVSLTAFNRDSEKVDCGAVTVKDNIAVIDYNLCNGCGKCKEVCKRGVII